MAAASLDSNAGHSLMPIFGCVCEVGPNGSAFFWLSCSSLFLSFPFFLQSVSWTRAFLVFFYEDTKKMNTFLL
jgi:hypothetical protein